MNNIISDELISFVPLLIKEGAVNDVGNFVKVSNAHWCTFLVAIGDADTAITVTVESCATNDTSTATNTAINFSYRLSGAASAGSDTWTALTTADSTGFSFTAQTDTGKLALIEVNPADMVAGDYYLRVQTAATSYNSPTPATVVIAALQPRYPQKEHLSST